MKLVICILHSRDKARVTEELVKAGFKFTIIGSTGGFLREGNTTLHIGCEDNEVSAIKKILDTFCQSRDQLVNVMPFDSAPPGTFMPSPVKVPVGGGVMFVLNVEQFHRF